MPRINSERKHVRTEESAELVRRCVIVGNSHEATAKILGVSPRTLRNHYQDILTIALAEANCAVAETAYRLAVSGTCPAMTMFWLKTKARWRETARIEHVTVDARIVDILTEWRAAADISEDQYDALVNRLSALQPVNEEEVGAEHVQVTE